MLLLLFEGSNLQRFIRIHYVRICTNLCIIHVYCICIKIITSHTHLCNYLCNYVFYHSKVMLRLVAFYSNIYYANHSSDMLKLVCTKSSTSVLCAQRLQPASICRVLKHSKLYRLKHVDLHTIHLSWKWAEQTQCCL